MIPFPRHPAALLTALLFPLGAAGAERPEPAGWEFRAGAGALLSPAYAGADVYHANALPYLRLSYGDAFFASVEEGVGYNLFDRDGWKAGPVLRVAFGRDEDGGGPFRIAGSRTDALRGLGDVPTTFEPGGFASYTRGRFRYSLEARHGVNGHGGFVAELAASHVRTSFALSPSGRAPAIFSIGPRLTFADARYRRAYFGVDARQSARSGLGVYVPGAGATSVGVGGVAILPLAPAVSASVIAGYGRLLGLANSPLIARSGSVHQMTVGLFVTRTFSFGGVPR